MTGRQKRLYLGLALAWFSACGVGVAATKLPADLGHAVEAGLRSKHSEALQSEYDAGADPVVAYHLSLLAARSTPRLLEASLHVPAEARGERLLLLTRQALAAGDALAAQAHASRFLSLYPEGPDTDQAQYLLAQAEFQGGTPAAAEERFDWLSRYGAQPWRGWGLYGQAHAALARGDTSEALRLLRKTSSLSAHEAVAPALLRLGEIHDARGATPAAFRYLTMYREAYPRGILPLLEHAAGGSDRAETAADLAYTVQVGVFGERANALRQRDQFTALKHKVTLKAKTVGDKRYTAVWVGRYKSREEARNVRQQLEAQFGETYHVVVFE